MNEPRIILYTSNSNKDADLLAMYTGLSRIRIRWRLAPALLAVVACASAYAVENPGTYAIAGQARAMTNTPASAWTLTIDGQWPTQCPPTLQNVSIDGTDLRIDAHSVLGLCERRTTPFSIEVNPALALDRPALAPNVYHVSFYAADGAQAQPLLRAFALVDRNVNAASIIPETGFWWSTNTDTTAADRTALSLEWQDGQLSVALMSYDNSGRPVWYFGAAPFAGRIAHVSLLQFAGGSNPLAQTASSPTAKPYGSAALTLDLQFHSAAHASAWLSRPRGDDAGLQLQRMDLVRLPLADASDGQAWQGDWILVTDTPNSVPQRLHLDRYQILDPAHFQLTDASGTTALICKRDPAQPEWPPSSCSLHQAAGDIPADFGSVAISRMDGKGIDGAAIHLLRVSP